MSERKSDQIKEEIVQAVRRFALDHPHINSELVNKSKELEKALIEDRFVQTTQEKRLEMFDKYIHTNSCSDEGGWFAFFTPEGGLGDLPEWRMNGCNTEEEAVRKLIRLAASTFEEKCGVD